MRVFDQEEINEGALIISLLIKTVIEVDDRSRNEQDDLLMAAAIDWIEEHSDAVEMIEMTRH